MKKLFTIAALATAVFCTPALAQNTSKGFYLGAALNAGDSNLSTAGFNTLGGFFNSDCDPKVPGGGGTCGDGETAFGGSVFIGKDAVLSYGNNTSIRVEAELSFSGDSDFITASFPGPPGPIAFFYRTEVSNLKTVFLNAYLDHAISPKFTVFANTGIGVSNFKLSTTDGVVGGNDSFTKFSYNVGLGAKYKVSKRVDIFGQIRHIYNGKANLALVSTVGAVPSGNYTARLASNEARLGLMVHF